MEASGERFRSGVWKGELEAVSELLVGVHGIDNVGEEKRGGVELWDGVSGASTDEPCDEEADEEVL